MQIPSYLGSQTRGLANYSNDLLSNYVLRVGEIKAIVAPGDPLNASKSLIEYTVAVVYRTGTGANTTVDYHAVTASNSFGGKADYIEATFRASSGKNENVDVGSKVLVLCISGDQSKAIIIGGIPDFGQKLTKQKKTHHYTFEFNGAYLNINDEGEVAFIHKGPTNADGSVKEKYKDYGGSNVRFDKNGDIIVSTPEGEQYFKLNHKLNEVELQADKKLLVNVRGQAEIAADGNVLIDSKDGNVSIEGGNGVLIGDATNAMILGDVYRQAEGQTNQYIAKSLHSASTSANVAGSSLLAAAPLNAIPMVGGVLAMPALIAAANALIAIGVSLNIAASAIDVLEGNYDKYLSPDNRNS